MSIVETIRARARAEQMVKVAAGASDIGTAVAWGLGTGLASAAVAYGLPAALSSIKDARVRADRDKLIQRMMAANPELRNYPRRDIDLVFNSLAIHAPDVLKDPLVGGQIMEDALRRGNRMDIGALNNISRLGGGSGLKTHEQAAINELTGSVSGVGRGIAARELKTKSPSMDKKSHYTPQARYEAYRRSSKV